MMTWREMVRDGVRPPPRHDVGVAVGAQVLRDAAQRVEVAQRLQPPRSLGLLAAATAALLLAPGGKLLLRLHLGDEALLPCQPAHTGPVRPSSETVPPESSEGSVFERLVSHTRTTVSMCALASLRRWFMQRDQAPNCPSSGSRESFCSRTATD
jgi:hypothetical protein